MKQPKKLTYFHKKYLYKKNLNPNDWALKSEDSEKWLYINKNDGTVLVRYKNA